MAGCEYQAEDAINIMSNVEGVKEPSESGASFTPKKKATVKRVCSVPGCTSSSHRDRDLTFHRLPNKGESRVDVWNPRSFRQEGKDRRQAWIDNLGLPWSNVKKYSQVCSKHFRREDFFLPGVHSEKRRLKKSAVPSVNLPSRPKHTTILESPSSVAKRKRNNAGRHLRAVKRLKLDDEVVNQNKETNTIQSAEEASNNISGAKDTADDGVPGTGPAPCNAPEFMSPEEEEQIVRTVLQLANSHVGPENKKTYVDMGTQVTSGDLESRFEDFVDSEKKLVALTGIGNFKIYAFLCNALRELVPDSSKSILKAESKVLLTFMKLRNNLHFTVLAVLFGVSDTTCKKHFESTLGALNTILDFAIQFPSVDEVRANIPNCFLKYRNVRLVLDCTEIKTTKSKCSICRAKSYSYYKSNHTIKFLIGMTPAGLISYVSKAFGGRCSDKAIFETSNVIDLLIPHLDAIMVDKGFHLKNICEENNIEIVIPPFLSSKKQFTQAEVHSCVRIASARVHVERIIERIKKYKILSCVIPWSMVRYADVIIRVVSAMVNMSNPILANDKFPSVVDMD